MTEQQQGCDALKWCSYKRQRRPIILCYSGENPDMPTPASRRLTPSAAASETARAVDCAVVSSHVQSP